MTLHSLTENIYLEKIYVYYIAEADWLWKMEMSISMWYSIIVFTLIKRSQPMFHLSPHTHTHTNSIINIRVTKTFIMWTFCFYFVGGRCTFSRQKNHYHTGNMVSFGWYNRKAFRNGNLRTQIEHKKLMKTDSLDREYEYGFVLCASKQIYHAERVCIQINYRSVQVFSCFHSSMSTVNQFTVSWT